MWDVELVSIDYGSFKHRRMGIDDRCAVTERDAAGEWPSEASADISLAGRQSHIASGQALYAVFDC